MKKKNITLTILTFGFVLSSAFTSLASWEQQTDGAWKYKDDTTGEYVVGWQWIDGNTDGISECYYLNENGVMAVNTTVESYVVNGEGQWTVDNVVQTQQTPEAVSTSAQESYVKTEIIECMGKDRAYIENKFGITDHVSIYDDSYTLFYDDLWINIKKETGLVGNISSRKLSAICNTLNNEEFDWDDTTHDSIREMARGMGEKAKYAMLNPYWSFYVEGHEYWLVYLMGGYGIM